MEHVRFHLHPLLIIVLTAPWIFGCKPLKQYPEETWVEIIGGKAQANTDAPGCNGRYTVNYLDVGALVQHSFTDGTTLAAGGGYVSTLSVSAIRGGNDEARISDKQRTPYFQAKVRFNWDRGALDLGILGVPGALHAEKQTGLFGTSDVPHAFPILRVRFPIFDDFYGSLGTVRSAAYIASGSIFDVGIGYDFKGIKTNAWVGFGTHPNFTNSQVIAEAECEATSHLRMKGSFNYGIKDNLQGASEPPEFGFSFGLLVRLQ
jgi:hypothetical protein